MEEEAMHRVFENGPKEVAKEEAEHCPEDGRLAVPVDLLGDWVERRLLYERLVEKVEGDR